VPALSERGGAGFQFTLMTDDPALAGAADEAGIDRVGLDLERLGKHERQGALPHLRISDHRVEQLPRLRSRLKSAQAFVRVNPLNRGSADEIERALDAGAEVLMLPYFRTAAEVESFVGLVRGRAFVTLLLETAAAADDVAAITRVRGVGEIMVGLNDLSLDLDVSNQFALLVSPVLERIAKHVRGAGLPFGCGGLADPANDALGVPPSLVCAQYPRLGATRAFVARTFTAAGLQTGGLKQGILRLRAELARWQARSSRELDAARDALAAAAVGLRIDQAPSATSVSRRSRPGSEWCSRMRSPSASETATRSSSFAR
jgi:2-keto-3-deoxy-L-rhamnonate aldolase RhmA